MVQRISILGLLFASLFFSACTIPASNEKGVAEPEAKSSATSSDRRSPGRIVDDQNLELLIAKKLLSDQYVSDYSHTNLTIYNGVVLVTGEASSDETRQRINNIILSVPGVKRLESDIVIGPTSSFLSRGTDSALTGKVAASLLTLKLPNLDTTSLNVSTERGNVYIMGIVTRAEGDAVAEKARRVGGVKSVTKVFEYLD